MEQATIIGCTRTMQMIGRFEDDHVCSLAVKIEDTREVNPDLEIEEGLADLPDVYGGVKVGLDESVMQRSSHDSITS